MADQECASEVQRRMNMPYHRVVYGDPKDGYMGQIAEFPGCYTTADTPLEALTSLDEAMAAWMESCLITGDLIPEPASGVAPIR